LKKILILLVVLAMIGAGAYAWISRQAKPAAESPDVAKIKVARGSIFQAVSSTGRVVSNLDVDIKCKASGEIIKLPFDVSQQVKTGDLLLEIDPVNQVRAVNLATVQLSQSKAKLKQAEQNLVMLRRVTLVITRSLDAMTRFCSACFNLALLCESCTVAKLTARTWFTGSISSRRSPVFTCWLTSKGSLMISPLALHLMSTSRFETTRPVLDTAWKSIRARPLILATSGDSAAGLAWREIQA